MYMDGHVRFIYTVCLTFALSDGPSFSPQAFLQSMSPSEVFACENGTLFFHQDENFFLAIGEILCFLCVFNVFVSLYLC